MSNLRLHRWQKTVLTVFCVAFGLFAVAVAAIEYFFYRWQEDNPIFEPLLAAHRGDETYELENTEQAFISAYEKGVDIIELDIQQSSDGVITVIHDGNLKSVFEIDMSVIENSYETLNEAVISSGKAASLPTLAGVLTFFRDKDVKILIDVKSYIAAEAVVDVVDKTESVEKVIIQSLNYEYLQRVKELSPTLMTALLSELPIPEIADYTDVDIYTIYYGVVTDKSAIDAIHSAGKSIYVWTLIDEAQINKYIDLRADGIVFSDTDMAKRVLEERRTRSFRFKEFFKYVGEKYFNVDN